jgi:chloramphenicol O-acetyltransferase type A
MTSESRYLDLDAWPRRAAFDYFMGFDKPYFNVCVRVDVAPLKAAAAARPHGGFVLACHYIGLRLCNLIEPFRYRLEGGRVRVHDVVQGGTTVLREDQSFGFAYLGHAPGYAAFAERGAAAMAAARSAHAAFDPRLDDSALIHFGSLPWLHFTSFSHARNWRREDSVPKIMFGRADAEGSRLMLPLSVEVHHALMDGVHVGQYVQAFEDAAREPEAWLRD